MHDLVIYRHKRAAAKGIAETEYICFPVTGEPSFDIGLGDIQAPQTTLDEIFAYLETADKPCIVAIDEFQQIGGYEEKNVEALLNI